MGMRSNGTDGPCFFKRVIERVESTSIPVNTVLCNVSDIGRGEVVTVLIR